MNFNAKIWRQIAIDPDVEREQSPSLRDLFEIAGEA